ERSRSHVMQQVLALYHAVQAQKIAVEKAELEAARVNQLRGKGAVGQEEFDRARSDLIAARAKLDDLQAQLDHLAGKPAADRHRAVVDRAVLWLAAQRRWDAQTQWSADALADYLAATQ